MSALIGSLVLRLVELAFIARALLRPDRSPASRVAWVVVIALLPVVGIVAYLLFGETSIGRNRIARARVVLAAIKPAVEFAAGVPCHPRPEIPDRVAPLFHFGASVNRFPPAGGNRAEVLADSDAAVEAMVADMDAAQHHVHVTFYIWLADDNGLKVLEALNRAAARGVACRAIVDGVGSRSLIASDHWQRLRAAGVETAVALSVGNPLLRFLLRPLQGRIDLRNHRKIVVIDDRVTYCGSQNCADAEFRVKPAFAPWVDIMLRFEGPIAHQNQCVFVSDWMTCVDQDIRSVLEAPPQAGTAPAVGTIVAALPPGCVPAPIGGIEYYDCAGVFYRPTFQGNNLIFVVQKP